MFVTMDQAKEFMETGRMYVGAANERWDTTLSSAPSEQSTLPSDFALKNYVAIRFRNPHHIAGEKEASDKGHLYEQQVIAPKTKTGFSADVVGFTHRPSVKVESDGRISLTPGQWKYDPSGKAPVQIKVIDANAWSYNEEMFGLNKADETWDDEEHPRDFDTGRFVSTRISLDTPPTSEDPRIARERRRRRRLKRAAEARATAPREASHDPRVRDRAQVERHNERIELQRRNARWLAQQKIRSEGLQLTPKEAKQLEDGIFAMGPQVRNWAGVNPRHDPAEVEDVVGPPKVLRGGRLVDDSPEPPPPSALRETEKLAAIPWLYDEETGERIRTPETDALIARQRARMRAHARKAKRSPS